MADELRKGPSGPPADFDAAGINAEIVAGFPETSSGGSTPATAGNPGYISRHAFVNAVSSHVGEDFAGVVIEAGPAIWTTAAQIPPGNWFEFVQTGSGGGAGSGCADRGSVGTFSIRGGAGGGGGAINLWTISRAALIAALPISFVYPLGGTGGASIVSTSGTVVGLSGSPGSTCSVSGTGLLEQAGGGFNGVGGNGSTTGTAGGGGGRLGDGGTLGGLPVDTSAAGANVIYNFQGGAAPNGRDSTGASGNSQYSFYGGSGGGSNLNTNSIVHAGRSKYGACGGGHGGRVAVNTALGTFLLLENSEGGNHAIQTLGNPNGGGGGTAATLAGGAGGDGADGNEGRGGEGGGGGKAATDTTDAGSIGGAGGIGGFPGGGGGGGAAGYRQTAAGQAQSGAGGHGEDGLILVTGYT
jgi:hypothetical protein